MDKTSKNNRGSPPSSDHMTEVMEALGRGAAEGNKFAIAVAVEIIEMAGEMGLKLADLSVVNRLADVFESASGIRIKITVKGRDDSYGDISTGSIH